MSPWVLLPFFALLLNVFFLTFTFAQRQRNKLNIFYLIYSAFVGIWLLDTALLWSHIPYLDSPWIQRLLSFSWIFIGTWFLRFAHELVKRERDRYVFFFDIVTYIAYAAALGPGVEDDIVLTVIVFPD